MSDIIIPDDDILQDELYNDFEDDEFGDGDDLDASPDYDPEEWN